MQYMNQAYQASLPDDDHAKISPFGYHPETKDRLFIPLKDRYAGTYILGVQGVGKSGLLENLITYDIQQGHAVFVVDPHGDLIDHCIAQLPRDKVASTYMLDMLDEAFPFGLNVFSSPAIRSSVGLYQAVDRVMHVFEVLWSDILTQAYLPRYLRAATITLFANPGSTLVDMHPLLLDSGYRAKMLRAVNDQSVIQFWQYYDSMSATQQRQQVEPLLGRLESIFMGRSLVRNIVGQRQTSINFRSAIENKETIFIRLPIKTLAQDARLIGTLLIAQLHAAIFSFSDIPEHQRPGFSLYIDEFQHFATSDFSEMFTEGRKFGVRVTLAHQYRNQLPTYLQQSTMTARTKVCFQVTPEDAREMAHMFLNGEATVAPEDIESRPVDHLLRYGSDNALVDEFIEWYVRPLQSQKHSGQVEIKHPGFRADHLLYWILNVQAPKEKPRVADPTPYLDHLLYEVMKTGQWQKPIPPQIVYGFSNCGRGFYSAYLYAFFKRNLLIGNFEYPYPLVIDGVWNRVPETSKEQLYHFLFHLRATMQYLAEHPIGRKSILSASDVARMLTQLPKRAAFVRSSEEVGVMYTDDTLPPVSRTELHKRLYLIRGQTRQKYCRPKDQPVEGSTAPHAPDEPISRWEEVE